MFCLWSLRSFSWQIQVDVVEEPSAFCLSFSLEDFVFCKLTNFRILQIAIIPRS